MIRDILPVAARKYDRPNGWRKNSFFIHFNEKNQ